MRVAYDATAWQTFYATLGSASAALVGLLFVALSLHRREIVTNPAARGRAREALGGFLSLLVLILLVPIPGQGRRLLGAELLVGGLVVVAFGIRLQGQTLRSLPARHRRRRTLHLAPIQVGTAMILVAGVSLMLGPYGGLFWFVPTVVGYLFNALANAWVLTVQTGEQ